MDNSARGIAPSVITTFTSLNANILKSLEQSWYTPVTPICSYKELYMQAFSFIFCTLWDLLPIKTKRSSIYTLDNVRTRHHVPNRRRKRNGIGDTEEVSEPSNQETRPHQGQSCIFEQIIHSKSISSRQGGNICNHHDKMSILRGLYHMLGVLYLLPKDAHNS